MADDTASGAAPSSGDLLDGRFELHEAIGRGASGQVFAAFDRHTGEEVALKVLAAGDGQIPHEARALSRLRHPNVVALRGFGIVPGGYAYLALERLSGHTLDQWLRRTPLSVTQLAPILAALASALDAAHAADFVHGDVRAANVFLEALDGRVKLLDFGGAVGPVAAGDDCRALAQLALDALTGERRSASAGGPRLEPGLAAVLEDGLAGRFVCAGELAEAFFRAAQLPWPPAPSREPQAPRERESFSAGRGSGLPAEPPSWMPEEPLRLSSVPPPPPVEVASARWRVALWAGLTVVLAASLLALWWLR